VSERERERESEIEREREKWKTCPSHTEALQVKKITKIKKKNSMLATWARRKRLAARNRAPDAAGSSHSVQPAFLGIFSGRWLCVFITAVSIIKLFAWGGGG
jgi:hypothetical protein